MVIHRVVVAIDDIIPADDLAVREGRSSESLVQLINPGIDYSDFGAVSMDAVCAPKLRSIYQGIARIIQDMDRQVLAHGAYIRKLAYFIEGPAPCRQRDAVQRRRILIPDYRDLTCEVASGALSKVEIDFWEVGFELIVLKADLRKWRLEARRRVLFL